ncbi:MAG: hypothetical protein ACJ77A_16080 [Actinomycetota bacterium]
MPLGRYVILDDHGGRRGTEDFRSAPGPMGWRYFSDVVIETGDAHHEIVDLVVDSAWRPVRTRIETGSHEILLTAKDDLLEGFLDRKPVTVPWGADTEIDYASPAFNVVTANRLGRSAEFDVVFLEPVTCEPVLQRQRYELIGEEEVETAVGRFAARRWQFTALSDGYSAGMWIVADVLVRYEGLYELEQYDPGATGPRVGA